MKYSLLILVLCLAACHSTFAQLITYHRYLDYETEWSEYEYGSFCDVSSIHANKLYGDTLINGIAYYKVGRIGIQGYCTYDPDTPWGWVANTMPSAATTVGYLRETEDKKIYYLPANYTAEYLLYDFAPVYAVGDATNTGCVVLAADTVYFGAEPRHRYILHPVNEDESDNQNYFVEGMGMISNASDEALPRSAGLLGGFLKGSSCGAIYDASSKMLCFRNSQGQYGEDCSENSFFDSDWDADLSLVYHINDSYTVYLILSNNPYMAPYQITGTYNGSFTPTAQAQNEVTYFVGNYPCGTPFELTITDGLGNSQSFGSANVSCEAPLPVNFIRFSAIRTLQGNRLNWTTANEQNNDYFGVERSTNGNQFTQIGKVLGSGNSQTQKQYSFTDQYADAAATQYYRLRQVDVDGVASYSNTIVVEGNINSETLQVTPNPVANNTFLLTNYVFIPNGVATLYNTMGKQVLSCALQPKETSVSVEALPAGIYVCKVGEQTAKVTIVR